jgi:hypothetical protein
VAERRSPSSDVDMCRLGQHVQLVKWSWPSARAGGEANAVQERRTSAGSDATRVAERETECGWVGRSASRMTCWGAREMEGRRRKAVMSSTTATDNRSPGFTDLQRCSMRHTPSSPAKIDTLTTSLRRLPRLPLRVRPASTRRTAHVAAHVLCRPKLWYTWLELYGLADSLLPG